MKKALFKMAQIVGASVFLMLVGCSTVPRGLHHTPTQPMTVVDRSQTEAERIFAISAAQLEVGGSGAVIQQSPIGMTQAFAVATYMNALGEHCKRVVLRGSDADETYAVCLGKDDVWRVVPSNY